MAETDQHTFDLLRLTMVPGLGPILISRLLAAFGTPGEALKASETRLRQIDGFGPKTARAVAAAMPGSAKLAEEELRAAEKLGVALIGVGTPEYPPLLAQIPDPPPVLYVLGSIGSVAAGKYPVAIVGSRSCTAYGNEQAERFALFLAQNGLTVVSGGARGIDTAAHRGAMRAGSADAAGLTAAVLGCGLAHRYPPDNKDLFDKIVAGGGALISELPLHASPSSENFPARNRIISGLSLGVLVIEAGKKSGSLITAQVAAEDHGREVFALPSRVDSAASEGSLELLKAGGAALVTHPKDVLDALESPARHLYTGTHRERYAGWHRPPTGEAAAAQSLFAQPGGGPAELNDEGDRAGTPVGDRCHPGNGFQPSLSAPQQAILAALEEAMTMDELAKATGLEPGKLRAELTVLEIGRRVTRAGTRVVKR